MIDTRTDVNGAVYFGISLDAHSTVFIPMHEAESLAAAIKYKLAELRKCG